jgi:hypothetical protein
MVPGAVVSADGPEGKITLIFVKRFYSGTQQTKESFLETGILMEFLKELDTETKRTEEEIRKKDMRKEIEALNQEINRTGHAISQELQGPGHSGQSGEDR